MKLIILISVLACSYAAKLDRTYLPPASASTAGGSPGSLIAPGAQSGLPSSGSSFGQPSGPSGFTQNFQSGPAINQALSGSPGFEQANGPASYAQAPKSGFEQTSQYSQPDASRSQFGRSGAPASVQNDGLGVDSPRNSYEQPAGFAPQEFQPERARASIDSNAEILRYDNQNDGETYAYSFETSNGISAEESGVATNGVQAQGGYSYTGDDGQQYRVTYTADENGFQPQGDHLPTPHPIPEEILRSIEQNARAAADGTQEGAYNPEEDFDNSNAIAQSNGNTVQFGDASRGYPGASSANQGSVPSYQNNQPSGKVIGSGNQSGQAPSAQYGAPNAPGYAKSSGAQGPNQYQPESNQGNPSAPTNPNFSAQRQRVSDQRSFEPSNSGLVRSGLQGQQQDDSGYQYSRPQAQSFGKTNQAELRPQQPQYQQQTPSSQYNKPEAQGPAGRGFDLKNLAPGSSTFGDKGLGSTLKNAPSGSSGPTNQGFGSAQTNIPSGQGYAPAGAPQGSSFPKSTENKRIGASSGTPESYNPVQGSPSSRLNGANRSYTPNSSSIPMPSSGSRSSYNNAPSSLSPNSRNTGTSQRPQFGSNNDQGYVYGPGINPDGVPARGPSGRGFQSTPSGYPSQSAAQPGIQTTSTQGLGSVDSSGTAPNNQGSYTRPTGSTTNPSQANQGSFSGPNTPSGPSQTNQGSYFAGSNAPSGSASPQAFGSTPKLQSSQSSVPKSSTPDSAPYQYNRPGSQGAPTGSSGPTDSLPGFRSESQPTQSSGTKSSSSDSSPYQFNRPGSQGAPAGPSQSQPGFGSQSQPGQSSAPKDSTGDSAPYQYNRPSQGSQTGPSRQSSSFPGFGQESQGSQRQPGSRPSETFSGPRQPPSFSSEEGYKY